ncbi:MAG: 16S rRNA (uracil(1498)-N(3))-methyltransferase [Desulfobulbus sp.]|nr:16S rRNA (uracil(1498)-N(3))-methyltransferase [Desulfobulbus sp.]
MNLLLIEPQEMTGNEVWLTDHRARHLIKVLKVTADTIIRAGVVNDKLGFAKVTAIEGEKVRLQVHLERKPTIGLHVELILALPRPVMLQRILKQATVLGVRHFHLIRTRRVEKSFFQSPVLLPEKIHALLKEGMEQAVDTWLPGVTLHRRFKPFIEDVLPTLEGRGLIAHPAAGRTFAEAPAPDSLQRRILLAIGPEGGWSDYEYQHFCDAGFFGLTMGARILHVDTAVVTALAQLWLLHDLRNR